MTLPVEVRQRIYNYGNHAMAVYFDGHINRYRDERPAPLMIFNPRTRKYLNMTCRQIKAELDDTKLEHNCFTVRLRGGANLADMERDMPEGDRFKLHKINKIYIKMDEEADVGSFRTRGLQVTKEDFMSKLPNLK